ncbi:MAG TPA: hypothetical protein VJ821_09945 [Anaerolineales bacterium]|nr:hypothetical protein [Anaerolineales bacterium]
MSSSTPTTDPRQLAKVVEAFWSALESGDLETAMVYVDEEATCSDVKNAGSIVTYSWEDYRNGNFIQPGKGNEMMQVEI